MVHRPIGAVPAAVPPRLVRVRMAARCLTAVFGGYAATAALASLIARALPLMRAEASTWGMTVSFLLYACIALWCFHEPRLARVAAWVWGTATIVGITVWLIGPPA